MKSLLAYLDRVYLAGQKKPDIGLVIIWSRARFRLTRYTDRALAYDGFLNHIFQNASIIKRLHEAIDQWVSFERTSTEDDQSKAHPLQHLIPALVKQLQRHGLYYDLFQSFYLKNTHDFYAQESTRLRETKRADEFVLHAKLRDDEEYRRAQALLPEDTADKVSLETSIALLTPHLEWVAREGTSNMSSPRIPE